MGHRCQLPGLCVFVLSSLQFNIINGIRKHSIFFVMSKHLALQLSAEGEDQPVVFSRGYMIKIPGGFSHVNTSNGFLEQCFCSQAWHSVPFFATVFAMQVEVHDPFIRKCCETKPLLGFGSIF